MKGIFGSKWLDHAMNRSFGHTRVNDGNRKAFEQGWKAACKFFERAYSAEEICCQCGKLLYESDNYFMYDEIGCFCEKCYNKIEEASKHKNDHDSD